ncbi:MAG: glycosyltransferase [Ruminococcus flavefaciens]|nr:glycosyltransferase [Muribaculum sp.]MCM1235760.1 glycosyltransferase [Ruminococcus flavefaciens]
MAEAIESVLKQSYPYFELIIVNDGSTDESEDVVKRYIGDKRIVYIPKSNTGLADSLNVGIKQSKYDWIVRMDGDDICHKDRFKVLVENVSDNLDIIGSNADYFNENGFVGTSQMPLSREDIQNNILKGRSAFIHPSVMIRKSLLEKVGGYDANFRRAQDHNLWIRCLKHANGMKNIEQPLLDYRYYPKASKTNYEAIINGLIDSCIIKKNISRALSKKEYLDIKKIIENTFVFKMSYNLSNFLYNPILRYLYPLWSRLGITNKKMNSISQNWNISE